MISRLSLLQGRPVCFLEFYCLLPIFKRILVFYQEAFESRFCRGLAYLVILCHLPKLFVCFYLKFVKVFKWYLDFSIRLADLLLSWSLQFQVPLSTLALPDCRSHQRTKSKQLGRSLSLVVLRLLRIRLVQRLSWLNQLYLFSLMTKKDC